MTTPCQHQDGRRGPQARHLQWVPLIWRRECANHSLIPDFPVCSMQSESVGAVGAVIPAPVFVSISHPFHYTDKQTQTHTCTQVSHCQRWHLELPTCIFPLEIAHNGFCGHNRIPHTLGISLKLFPENLLIFTHSNLGNYISKLGWILKLIWQNPAEKQAVIRMPLEGISRTLPRRVVCFASGCLTS